MKRLCILLAVVFVGVAAWRIGDLVSHDVIVMSIGVLFGVLAGVPASLLIMATQRRAQPEYARHDDCHRSQAQQPIIVLGGNPQQPYQHQGQHGYQQVYQPITPHDQTPLGATGGGNFYMLTGPADTRFVEETQQKWNGR